MSIFYDPSSKKWNVTYEKTDYPIPRASDYPQNQNFVSKWWGDTCYTAQACEQFAAWQKQLNQTNADIKKQNDINDLLTKELDEQKETNTALNVKNTNKNKIYDAAIAAASRTQGGDYVAQRDPLLLRLILWLR
jgi:hypothetical protein